MQDAQTGREDRSVGELFAELSREVSTLVRQEVALARTEMGDKVKEVGKDAGFLAAGGVVAYAGMLTLIAAIVLILMAAGLPAWASALLVGIVVAGAGIFMVFRGLSNLKRVDATPHETVESLQEDAKWAKRQFQ